MQNRERNDMGNNELEVLEKFICDEDLKTLEKKFNKFNIFDCLRLTRTEIRHSNFLAWLLDPNETHGLNDYFLKEFLKEILINNKNKIEKINGKNLTLKKYESDETIVEKYTIPSLFDIDYWDMQNAEILREHENIDLLAIDETNKFVFVIENKVDTCQHDNQLTKYRTYVDEQYSNSEYKKLYVYLKPKKEDVEEPYIYIGYDLIQKILEKIINDKQINNEVLTSIKHYKYILERDFMQKDEISEICRRIYKKHKTAIDLINKYSNPQKEIKEILDEIFELQSDSWYRINAESNSSILCIPNNIQALEKLKIADWEENDNYLTCLKFVNFRNKNENGVWIEILIAPARTEKDNQLKNDLIKALKDKSVEILQIDKKGWCWSKPQYLLTLDDYCNSNNPETLKDLIVKQLKDKNNFIRNYIDSINSIIN